MAVYSKIVTGWSRLRLHIQTAIGVMNKKELIRDISQELDSSVSQEKIAVILDTAVSVVKRTLDVGEPVKWSGFGTLTVKEIPPKRLYSPTLKKYIVTKNVRKIVFVEPRRRK
ncbi:HU family DNA-binding protein [uncultured Alistipes sp.]|uniref:HU family DNA-binding protein n=3 Tax=Alistipes TaxID=239759 RepID=UPI0011DD7C24|nr:HU family DNA-binding protein [uncultured Alistipes sp.]